jgi:hypothetical protein
VTNDWIVWQHSSAGPTWDGRKKPDLLALPGGGTSSPDGPGTGYVYGTPVTTYGNAGEGTSFAAPMVAGGVALLASVGVVDPMAQRAILITNARPIQDQTYWTPTSGWGALDLEATFNNRANWAQGAVSSNGANSARFYRQSSPAAGARTTLAWNRRHRTFTGGSMVTPWAVTNLDLFQFAESQPNVSTADFGSDAADNVDTNLVASGIPDPQAPGRFGPGNDARTDNPMPGSGEDGEDNIEQLRTKSGVSGAQIIKVRAMGPIEGVEAEPFALASERPITPLASPIPKVTLTPAAANSRTGEDVQVTATIENPSMDLALDGASAEFTAMSGATVTPASAALGTLAPGSSTTRILTVRGTAEGAAAASATASGTVWGELFEGRASAAFNFDDSAPVVSIDPLSPYTSAGSAPASWSASDNLTGVGSFDAEVRVGSDAWIRVVDAGNATTHELVGSDGDVVTLRVRARDVLGNLSSWQEGTTTFAQSAPVITFGAAQRPRLGQIVVPVSVSSSAAPIANVTYGFGPCGCETWLPLTGNPSFTNLSRTSAAAILVVNATDSLGRTVQRRQSFSVESSRRAANLRISAPKQHGKRLTISGRIDAGFDGTVKVTITRTGRTGMRKVVRRAPASGGRYSLRVRLARGRYRVQASTSTSTDFLGSRVSRLVRVK